MAEELFANRYRLIEPLGRGAMSAVWLAEDTELARHVAVKTLGPSADRQRFTREARAVAALSHPNICALYDFGEADGRPYMVLEYLPSGSLEDRLAAGEPLPDADAARIATDVAAGLAHAHERGLVHRDLKPANILFDGEGRAKIADFGIARMGGTGTLTEAGTVLGTASYISPEQAAGEPAGPASDVYSFGVVLFRMLTGRLPFVGRHAMEVVRMHRDDRPPSVVELRTDGPAALAALADRSLAKDPALRPGDGAALLAALRGEERTLVAAPAVLAETEATRVLRPTAPPAGRRRPAVLAALLAVALLAAGGVLAYVLTRNNGSAKPPPSTGLSLPTISTERSTTEPATTAPTTTRETTTEPTTSAPATTAATTTALATTTPVTTVPTISVPTTTALPTTAPTTTEITTTTPGTTTLTTP